MRATPRDPVLALRTALQRSDQLGVLVALVAVVLAAWVGTIATGRSMTSMHSMDGMGAAATGWSTIQLVTVAVMWVVMMVAMMLPSAAPMVLVHAGVARRRRGCERAWLLVISFVSGYLLVWGAFGLTATGLQWWLDRSGLLVAGGRVTSTIGGLVLLAAGAYQFTTWKQACLRQCRTPMSFLLHDWRDGTVGSLRMGLRHGLVCTGCCLGLMVVLFAVGVMSLAWMAVVTAIVAAEKLLPGGQRIATAGGTLLVAGGLWLTIGTIVA
ncbi:MAG: DUF2182 domain-containing protein [Nitriliruptoraceae bacterium]